MPNIVTINPPSIEIAADASGGGFGVKREVFLEHAAIRFARQAHHCDNVAMVEVR